MVIGFRDFARPFRERGNIGNQAGGGTAGESVVNEFTPASRDDKTCGTQKPKLVTRERLRRFGDNGEIAHAQLTLRRSGHGSQGEQDAESRRIGQKRQQFSDSRDMVTIRHLPSGGLDCPEMYDVDTASVEGVGGLGGCRVRCTAMRRLFRSPRVPNM